MIFNIDDVRRSAPVSEQILYSLGDERTAVTGGWAAFAPAWGGTTAVMYRGESAAQSRQNPVGCNKNSENLSIYFKLPNAQAAFANGAFGTVSSLDLSGYTQLHVLASAASSSGVSGLHYCVCGVTTSKSAPTDGTNTPPGTFAAMGPGETVLDISSLSGGYVYVAGMSRANGPTTMDKIVDIVVTRVWLT